MAHDSVGMAPEKTFGLSTFKVNPPKTYPAMNRTRQLVSPLTGERAALIILPIPVTLPRQNGVSETDIPILTPPKRALIQSWCLGPHFLNSKFKRFSQRATFARSSESFLQAY
jgi:hypothetical protein